MGYDGVAQGDDGPLPLDEPGYGIGAVAKRIGVPVPTLRTWNMRYGIGPSRRSPGGHRRYDDADLRRLEEMNRLIHAGVAPADAARQALRPRPPAGPEAPLAPVVRPAAAADGTSSGEPGSRAGVEADGRPGTGPEGREDADGGGPPGDGPTGPAVLKGSARNGLPSAAMLARAALSLDGPTVGGGLEAALRRQGVVWTWERLVRPAFAIIVRKQTETGEGVEIEHLFSHRLLDALAVHARRAPAPARPRPVLLACAADEQHGLPVYALAAALSERAVETRVLGPRTPYAALAAAMRRLGPSVVFLWSQRRETGDTVPLGALPRLRPASRLVVGGPGWAEEVPPGTARVSTFSEAVTTVMGFLR
ncbi:MerR family transcriptional regulator [Sphaerisporangium dianthi]|uniref:MerR family transcriptional regulator n=1 Tax=Sphaerisporangium dianthi TaxID=1436120 RepID=A0ABV9CM87_9ACTN